MLSENEKEMEEKFDSLTHETLSISKEINFSVEGEDEDEGEEVDEDQPLIQRKRGKRSFEVPLQIEVPVKRQSRAP